MHGEGLPGGVIDRLTGEAVEFAVSADRGIDSSDNPPMNHSAQVGGVATGSALNRNPTAEKPEDVEKLLVEMWGVGHNLDRLRREATGRP